jgi:hypothetical protein
MQKGERRKGTPTTTTGLPTYPYGAILAVGESKDPTDAAENARCYCGPNHLLAPSLSHDTEFH